MGCAPRRRASSRRTGRSRGCGVAAQGPPRLVAVQQRRVDYASAGERRKEGPDGERRRGEREDDERRASSRSPVAVSLPVGCVLLCAPLRASWTRRESGGAAGNASRGGRRWSLCDRASKLCSLAPPLVLPLTTHSCRRHGCSTAPQLSRTPHGRRGPARTRPAHRRTPRPLPGGGA